MSLDGDTEVKPTANQQRLLEIYKSVWADLDDGARRKKWDRAGRGLTVEQLMRWWAEMSEELKIGLTPPEQLEKRALVSEIANLQ